MSKLCAKCGKGVRTGNSVSHSHRKTRRRWEPNLQMAAYFKDDGKTKIRQRVCTKCMKVLKKLPNAAYIGGSIKE
jgi:large subunit ribosomal protein L28